MRKCAYVCVRRTVGRVTSKRVPLCSCVVICVNEACNGGVWAHDSLIMNTLGSARLAPVLMLTDALGVAC